MFPLKSFELFIFTIIYLSLIWNKVSNEQKISRKNAKIEEY